MTSPNRRPVSDGNGGYKCAQGYKACNTDWLQSAESAEFVTCILDSMDAQAECPITSIALSLSGMTQSDQALY